MSTGPGGGQQPVLAGRRRQLREPRAEDEAALHVAGHHAVVLQRDREPVRGRAGETGGGDQPGQGGRTGLQRAQHQSRLVENADAARVVHATILTSQSVKRKFNISREAVRLGGTAQHT